MLPIGSRLATLTMAWEQEQFLRPYVAVVKPTARQFPPIPTLIIPFYLSGYALNPGSPQIESQITIPSSPIPKNLKGPQTPQPSSRHDPRSRDAPINT